MMTVAGRPYDGLQWSPYSGIRVLMYCPPPTHLQHELNVVTSFQPTECDKMMGRPLHDEVT